MMKSVFAIRKQAVILIAVSLIFTSSSSAQNDRCDPNKVVGSDSCSRCHVNESASWKLTPHFRTYEELSRSPEAQEICNKLGIRSVKRSDVCINCHFTSQTDDEKVRPISGVSCESCHGAAADWINTHNVYLNSNASKESETPQQRQQRLDDAVARGMNNTQNLYEIASNCLNCHTIPNETLVNLGGHKATSDDFEFVRWSQGHIRHNFLRTAGTSNATSTPERLRVMYVVGLIADLEFSTRATAKATEKSTYGLTVAKRAAQVAIKLFEIQRTIDDPNLETALVAFASVELRLNNQDSLLAAADQIRSAGMAFAAENDGSNLAALDAMLPDPSQYK